MLCYLCFKVENYDILLPFNKVSFLVLQDLSSVDKKQIDEMPTYTLFDKAERYFKNIYIFCYFRI